MGKALGETVREVQQCFFRFSLWLDFSKVINAHDSNMRPHFLQEYHSPQVCSLLPFPTLSALHVLLLCKVKVFFPPFLFSCRARKEGRNEQASSAAACPCHSTGRQSSQSLYSTQAEKMQFPAALHCVTCDPPVSSLESPSAWNDQADCLASSSGLKSVENRMLLLWWPWQCPEGNTEERI